MKENKRLLSVLLCVVMVVGLVWGSSKSLPVEDEGLFEYTDSLVVWYADESLTDYLNAMAVEYHENYGMRVIPRLHSGEEYVEAIYAASMEGSGAPDLYIVGNDSLEKACLSGCASEIDDTGVITKNNFPEVSLDAVTYKDKLVAYPYYFETSVLLYNKTYLYDMAKNLVMAEAETEPDEEEKAAAIKSDSEKKEETSTAEAESSEAESETVTEEEVIAPELEAAIEEKVEASIPKTFDELMVFADEYDAPPQVETVFKWDVRDIFFNYFFVGDYINIGGKNGDDSSVLSIYNLEAINALRVYQDLNQFFSFESEDVTYAQVVDEFIQGKLVMATATSDIISKLEQAKEDGEFVYEYGLAPIPDLNEELTTRGMSVTNCVVVNGYSDKLDAANMFAQYLTVDKASGLYAATGKLPVVDNISGETEAISIFRKEYSESAPSPKLMATSNYWLQLETIFADVWAGSSVSDSLKALSEQMQLQINGTIVEQEYIDVNTEEETIEYLDEEQLREEALTDE